MSGGARQSAPLRTQLAAAPGLQRPAALPQSERTCARMPGGRFRGNARTSQLYDPPVAVFPELFSADR